MTNIKQKISNKMTAGNKEFSELRNETCTSRSTGKSQV